MNCRDVDRWLEWPTHGYPLYSAYNPLSMSGSVRDAWYQPLDNVHNLTLIAFAIPGDGNFYLLRGIFIHNTRVFSRDIEKRSAYLGDRHCSFLVCVKKQLFNNHFLRTMADN